MRSRLTGFHCSAGLFPLLFFRFYLLAKNVSFFFCFFRHEESGKANAALKVFVPVDHQAVIVIRSLAGVSTFGSPSLVGSLVPFFTLRTVAASS